MKDGSRYDATPRVLARKKRIVLGFERKEEEEEEKGEAYLAAVDGILEEIIEQQVLEIRILDEGFLDVSQKHAPDNEDKHVINERWW